MIDKANFREVLKKLGFTEHDNVLTRNYSALNTSLMVDFLNEKIIYPEKKKLIVNERQTCNFSQNENFVVFVCIHRLFEKGYKPEHIELEPRWQIGHGASGGRADIMVKNNLGSFLIIECKTPGKEFGEAWKNTRANGGQLFSYAQQEGTTQFLCLYTADYIDHNAVHNYFLITLQDNEKRLQDLASNRPLSYAKAKQSTAEALFTAWKATYELDCATKGIFEEDIPAYEIGKTKYTIKDLTQINSSDIQGKYYEFATILRQHNISGRENAFDKLVSLFLCKIVDETNNPSDLKFSWKGISHDSYFDLVDRLQQLYQEGMKQFLGEEVVYISPTQIESAFEYWRNDPEAARETVKKLFTELKYFNNNDFGFVDVHNEKLFFQNTAVLLRVVQIFQDIKLKNNNNEHQFLGDMFESFLDQGIKQSEGQFFTPMPIVKFIIKSLPLEKIISESREIPQMIDYACGAGHFLNDYAKEIKPYVEKYKRSGIKQFYKNIRGIEKEYRLSKVAKVSAFMYGQDTINIIYGDALATNSIVKNNTYSILATNPPYSVKGFLETLSEHDRKKFMLFNMIDKKSYSQNNSIEAFFIERAKQLLKPGGVAGIIVPSSVLTKGKSKTTSKFTNIYVATREILFKYFDIIAIAEFGSGTFGKTGTNTVILFLQRRKENPSPSEQYLNRVSAWFNGDRTKDFIYEDEYFIKQYCNHLGFDFKNYETLLDGKPNAALLATDIFKDYRNEFDKRIDIVHLKKQKGFKSFDKKSQIDILDKRFHEYVKNAEKEKLYYFIMAMLNSKNTLIIRSPSKTSEIKKFLGYEWSNAKGNEGIKYISKDDTSSETEDDEKTDAEFDSDDNRILKNITTLDVINTPLYDPENNYNAHKINFMIVQNYLGHTPAIPDSLSQFVNYVRLVDMIDFSQVDFNKTIKLAANNKITLDTQWPLKKISEITSEIISGSRPTGGVENIKSGILSLGGEHIHCSNGYLDLSEPRYVPQSFFLKATSGKIKKFDILLCKDGALTGKIALIRDEIPDCNAMVNEHVFILRCFDLNTQLYLFNFLLSEMGQTLLKEQITGSAQGGLNLSNLKNIKMPFPPVHLQKDIVEECLKIDAEINKSKGLIKNEKNKIKMLLENFEKMGYPLKPVSELAKINPSKKAVKNLDENIFVSFIEMASLSEDGYIADKIDRKLKEVNKGSYRYFSDGDIIIAKITPCMENGKCAIATNLTNGIGFGSSEFHVFRVEKQVISNQFLFAFLNRESVRIEAAKNMTGSSGHRRVPENFYRKLKIPVPVNKKQQEELITAIEFSRIKIREAQKLINSISKRKEKIIRKYL
jgi:type I restriction-modification system DNA methylase subunit/restriction endonuclease S subunit